MDNKNINELLENIIMDITAGNYNAVLNDLSQFLDKYPEQIDQRAKYEIRMIEKILEDRVMLQDWDYYINIKSLYDYLKNTYSNDDVCKITQPIGELLPNSDTIWWCWLQGMENAPDVCKICYESVTKLDREIVVVTEKNLGDYVDIPDYIMDLWQEGTITNAHFSDILRAELLVKRGGIWIDSTVFISDPVGAQKYITDPDLFCFRSVMRDGSSDFITYDSWFLRNARTSGILSDTLNMLEEYWKREHELKHYFLFHLFFTLATWRHPQECASIPIYSTEPCHVMQLEMMNRYNEKRWEQLLGMSPIHKLTYKYDPDLAIRGSIVEHILKGTK